MAKNVKGVITALRAEPQHNHVSLKITPGCPACAKLSKPATAKPKPGVAPGPGLKPGLKPGAAPDSGKGQLPAPNLLPGTKATPKPKHPNAKTFTDGSGNVRRVKY